MRIIELGLTDYSETYKLQLEIADNVRQGILENTLIITEHRSVITIGRRGCRSNILDSPESLAKHGMEIIETDRGGDVTYHGPGQLIAYPVFKLENEARDIHGFLNFLEDAGECFLGKYGVTARKRPGFRGLWVNGEKLGSIGIGVRKWVTYHGIAININTDLAPFSFIKACGIEGVKVSSLKNILGQEQDINEAGRRLRESFKEVSLLVEAFSKV